VDGPIFPTYELDLIDQGTHIQNLLFADGSSNTSYGWQWSSGPNNYVAWKDQGEPCRVYQTTTPPTWEMCTPYNVKYVGNGKMGASPTWLYLGRNNNANTSLIMSKDSCIPMSSLIVQYIESPFSVGTGTYLVAVHTFQFYHLSFFHPFQLSSVIVLTLTNAYSRIVNSQVTNFGLSADPSLFVVPSDCKVAVEQGAFMSSVISPIILLFHTFLILDE
jgi:hypothetical protein